MIYYSNDIIDNILRDNTEKKYRFHYLYIISFVRISRLKDKRLTRDDFVPVNVDFLRKILIFDKAHIFLQDLVDLGILECNETFSRKLGISRGYRLSRKVLESKFYKEKNTDLKLDKKIEKVFKQLKDNLIKEDEFGYGYVTECMEDLHINHTNALLELKNHSLDKEQLDNALMSIDNFKYKFFTKDKTANRLHNNLTNLFTPLRKHISYKGEKIIQCDIRNSQLVFLFILMKDYNIPEEEMNLFQKVVCEFGFYEFLADSLGETLTSEKRKEFKVEVFKQLLFSPNKSKLSKPETVFKESFPNIFHIIRRIKTKNYKDLSVMLQRKESEFIFNCVRKMNKSIPLFTIHDSICTTIGKEQTVFNTMLSEFKNKHKISPKIVVEKFA